MNAFVKCAVTNGVFADERGIAISVNDGRKITFFADKAFVRTVSQPEGGESVEERRKTKGESCPPRGRICAD